VINEDMEDFVLLLSEYDRVLNKEKQHLTFELHTNSQTDL